MPKIEWTDEFSVKIFIFDEEHKHLVSLLNSFEEAMLEGKVKEILVDTITELSDYSKIHFKHEEEAMKKYHFPEITAHVKEHNDFIDKLHDIQDQFSKGSITLSLSIYNFIVNWILNHVLKTDKNYSEFLVNAGMK
jgi:hemerythrin